MKFWSFNMSKKKKKKIRFLLFPSRSTSTIFCFCNVHNVLSNYTMILHQCDLGATWKYWMLEMNQALMRMDHAFVNGLEKKYATYYVTFVCFCTLHLVFMLRGVLCVCQTMKVERIFWQLLCIFYHLSLLKKTFDISSLVIVYPSSFFMFCCMLLFTKLIALSIGLSFSFHPLSCYSIA